MSLERHLLRLHSGDFYQQFMAVSANLVMVVCLKLVPARLGGRKSRSW